MSSPVIERPAAGVAVNSMDMPCRVIVSVTGAAFLASFSRAVCLSVVAGLSDSAPALAAAAGAPPVKTKTASSRQQAGTRNFLIVCVFMFMYFFPPFRA